MSTLRCSFCQKGQGEVKKVIAGPGTYICDECVVICTGILHEGGIVHFVRVAPEDLELPLSEFTGQLSPTPKAGDLLTLLEKRGAEKKASIPVETAEFSGVRNKSG